MRKRLGAGGTHSRTLHEDSVQKRIVSTLQAILFHNTSSTFESFKAMIATTHVNFEEVIIDPTSSQEVIDLTAVDSDSDMGRLSPRKAR